MFNSKKKQSCVKVIIVTLFLCSGITLANANEEKKVDGRKIFEYHCKTCHGQFGKATKRGRALKAPDFADVEWQDSHTDKEIIGVITNGKNKMPRWIERLTPEEIQAVAKYVRKFRPRGSTPSY